MPVQTISLRVPEVWRHTGDTLQIFRLLNEQYVPTPTSPALVFFPAAVLTAVLRQGSASGIIPMMRAWRSWVRTHRPLEG